MPYPRWSTNLLNFRVLIWLLLPLVGAVFWLTTGWITDQVLSQTYPTTAQLNAEGQQQVQLSLSITILAIDAEVNRRGQSTEVNVRTGGSALEELEFAFPVAEFEQVEAAIAQELGLSPDDVRQLIRYRID